MCWHHLMQVLRPPSRWLVLVLLAVSYCPCSAYSDETAAPPRPGNSHGVGAEMQGDTLYRPDLTYRTVGQCELKLDLVLPDQGEGPFPTVVLFHGAGPFTKGRKGLMPWAKELAVKGYVAVAVSYRCRPEAAFPAPVHDAKCAVHWLRAPRLPVQDRQEPPRRDGLVLRRLPGLHAGHELTSGRPGRRGRHGRQSRSGGRQLLRPERHEHMVRELLQARH